MINGFVAGNIIELHGVVATVATVKLRQKIGGWSADPAPQNQLAKSQKSDVHIPMMIFPWYLSNKFEFQKKKHENS